jgi:hypothetical protein
MLLGGHQICQPTSSPAALTRAAGSGWGVAPKQLIKAAPTQSCYFANSLMLKSLGDRMPVSIIEVAVASHYVESLVVLLLKNREQTAVAQLVAVLRPLILELPRSKAQLIAVR